MYVTVTTQKQKLTKAIILIYSCSENFAYKCIMACIYTKIRGQFSFINQDQTHPVELGKGAGAHRLTLIPGIDQSCVAHRSSKFSVTVSQSFFSSRSLTEFCHQIKTILHVVLQLRLYPRCRKQRVQEHIQLFYKKGAQSVNLFKKFAVTNRPIN